MTTRNHYKTSDKDFIITVLTSTSINEVLKKLNLNVTGTAYKNIKKRIEFWGIDTSHFVGQAYLRGKSHNWAPKQDINKILIKNSTYACTSSLRKRLIKEKILENKCYGDNCSITSTWNGKPIVLQLDHINGINNDNRRENLRLLCPNCHSQTETFAGKNIGGQGGT